MATWDTYDFDKACEDASWYWLTLGSPYVTPNQNKTNRESVFNVMVGQSCYNAFRKGGIAFAQNWAACAARRYAAKLTAFGKTSDPAFPSAWMYEIHVEAQMWVAINQAQKDMAASGEAATSDGSAVSKIDLATQTRLITALPGTSTTEVRSSPTTTTPTLTSLLRTAAPTLTPQLRTAAAPTTPTLTQLLRTGASTATPIVLAPVPIPGVPPEPTWPTEPSIPPQSDEPMVTKPMTITPTTPPPSVDFRELRAWEGYSYYGAGAELAASVAMTLAEAASLGIAMVGSGTRKGSPFITIKKTGSGTKEDIDSFIANAQAQGNAVLLAKSNAFPSEEAIDIINTRDIVLVSETTMSDPTSFVYKDPTAGWQKPGELVIDGGMKEVAEVIGEKAKTGLIIGGVVVGVLALGGIAYYYSTRKPATMRANKSSEKWLQAGDRSAAKAREFESRGEMRQASRKYSEAWQRYNLGMMEAQDEGDARMQIRLQKLHDAALKKAIRSNELAVGYSETEALANKRRSRKRGRSHPERQYGHRY